MRPRIYVDTTFYLAMWKVGDSKREQARKALDKIRNHFMITSSLVLVEFLAGMSKINFRPEGIKAVSHILSDNNTQVYPVKQSDFMKGFSLYSDRLDKEYSLVDCISMNIAKENGVNKILTSDKHFRQEGFEILF